MNYEDIQELDEAIGIDIGFAPKFKKHAGQQVEVKREPNVCIEGIYYSRDILYLIKDVE